MKHSECATVPISFYWGTSAGLEMSCVPPEESGELGSAWGLAD